MYDLFNKIDFNYFISYWLFFYFLDYLYGIVVLGDYFKFENLKV